MPSLPGTTIGGAFLSLPNKISLRAAILLLEEAPVANEEDGSTKEEGLGPRHRASRALSRPPARAPVPEPLAVEPMELGHDLVVFENVHQLILPAEAVKAIEAEAGTQAGLEGSPSRESLAVR